MPHSTTPSGSNTIYLITGANRGIGRGIVESYLLKPNSTVIACVRDPTHMTSQSLLKAPKFHTSTLLMLPLEHLNEDASTSAIRSLTQIHGISHLDVVIANAAIGKDFAPIATVPLSAVRSHVDINAYGTLTLFQAVIPLLEKSKSPKFIALGSPLGSVGGMDLRPDVQTTAYGVSKAMVHYFVRKIHFEHENVTAVVLDPGFVQTDMGNSGARSLGLEKAYDTVEDSVNGCISAIDNATKHKTSGRFVAVGKFAGVEGEDFPW
ncbi:putative aflatoxin biosynthesis ketoreductase nor-1 [Zopfia rhizophila CBS 207.26]|uniref:Putative aflatoxin biosynthesis ketoreductase nor-1 n=1 Tax=Zopfia rhizophila CBS 207.26 TaxID=1314779 RepID=A0A6A6ES09_9PEZI|nr:putative aflatoxin biosynthesis ketoreductase nor-1 [Zopfia rhizophila CBS 207.26]